MEMTKLQDQLANDFFEIDELGRLVIKDPEVLNLITGANAAFGGMMPESNCGCGGGNCNC